MPVQVIITQGTTADCTQASHLIEGITEEQLLANRGYDSDVIVKQANQQGMQVTIPPRKNRKNPRQYDIDVFKFEKDLISNNIFTNF